MELPYDPVIPFLGIYLKKLIQKDYMHPYVHCSVIYNGHVMEVPINGGMDKKAQVHAMEYYSAIKMNKILPFATACIDLEVIMFIEISQSERQIPQDFTYMWTLKLSGIFSSREEMWELG